MALTATPDPRPPTPDPRPPLCPSLPGSIPRSALILTTVTTTRKFFTIMGSVFWFGHELKPTQWIGIGLVSAGLGLELYGKYAKNQAKVAKKAE